MAVSSNFGDFEKAADDPGSLAFMSHVVQRSVSGSASGTFVRPGGLKHVGLHAVAAHRKPS